MFDPDVLIEQLGGQSYLDSIHAIDLEKGDNFVSFLLPVNGSGKSFIKIIYDVASDLYVMEFWDYENGNLIERINEVYCDMLQIFVNDVATGGKK